MKIYVTDPDGAEHALEAIAGWRVMEIIREHGLPIRAECGGACACATCHVHIDPAWVEKIPPVREEEDYMLDDVFDRQPSSRLSCQIIMDERLDGLKLRLARADE